MRGLVYQRRGINVRRCRGLFGMRGLDCSWRRLEPLRRAGRLLDERRWRADFLTGAGRKVVFHVDEFVPDQYERRHEGGYGCITANQLISCAGAEADVRLLTCTCVKYERAYEGGIQHSDRIRPLVAVDGRGVREVDGEREDRAVYPCEESRLRARAARSNVTRLYAHCIIRTMVLMSCSLSNHTWTTFMTAFLHASSSPVVAAVTAVLIRAFFCCSRLAFDMGIAPVPYP